MQYRILLLKESSRGKKNKKFSILYHEGASSLKDAILSLGSGFLDYTTGLYNTRYLDYFLKREVSKRNKNFLKVGGKGAKYGHGKIGLESKFSVLFIDVDDFKSFNDRYGHTLGNALLNQIGIGLQDSVPEDATVFRYGGDEFVVFLPRTDDERAQKVAKNIRNRIKKLKWRPDRKTVDFTCTVSIGASVFPDQAKKPHELITLADRAMYRVKKVRKQANPIG